MHPDDAEQDDQHWFDLMAGRSVPDAHGRTRADAAWLRAALLAYRLQPPPGQVPAAEQRVQRLLSRAVEAGVLAQAGDAAQPQATPPRPSSGRRLWQRLLDRLNSLSTPLRGWRLAPALAVLVLAIGLIFQQLNTPSERPNVERGPAVQQISASDPGQRQQQLVKTLRAAGIDAQPFERLGRLGVDIELAVPLPPAQAQALQREGLRPPEGPNLVVEVLPAR